MVFYQPNTGAEVIFSLLDILAAVSNLAVILLVFYKPSLRTVSNLLVAGLALAEFSISVLVIPFSIVAYKRHSWPFGEGFCVFNGYFYHTLYIATATFTSVISVDRYYSLANPMSHTANISEKHLLWVVSFVLLQSAFWASLPLFTIGELRYSFLPKQSRCGFKWTISGSLGVYYFLIVMVSFILPVTAIVIMYHKSVRAAMKSARKIRPGNIQFETSKDGQFTSVAKAQSTGSFKAVFTVSIIIGSFLASRSPMVVCNIGSWYSGQDFCPPYAELAFSWLLYLGPLTNPYVYTILNRRLRNEVTRTIKSFISAKSNEEEEEEPKDILEYLRTLTDNYVSPSPTNSAQGERSSARIGIENVTEIETLPTPESDKSTDIEMQVVETGAIEGKDCQEISPNT
jgi:hypothetical protein